MKKDPSKVEVINEVMMQENLTAIALLLKTEKYLKALEAAIQTLRKTECYGDNYPNKQLDFEWPLANDLRQMPMNMQIKIKDL